jgi:predicted PP-loop superfamily ATPase
MAEPPPGAYSNDRKKERGPIAMHNNLDIEGRPADTRVVVAMSGGVDSSVTAALLAEAGFAALRPWRRDPPQGRLLRRPRHS